MELGDKIKNRRLELGLTLEEVGKMVGVGKSTVMKWETGYIENMKRGVFNFRSGLFINFNHLLFCYVMWWLGKT